MEYFIKDFETLNKHLQKEDTLIYVKGNNCGVCEVMYPIIKDKCDEYNVDILVINIEEFKEFTGKYMAFTIPTVLIFYYDKEMIRESRFINQANIDKYFNRRFS